MPPADRFRCSSRPRSDRGYAPSVGPTRRRSAHGWRDAFRAVRAETERRAAPLAPRTSWSSRCRMPARPNGTARIRTWFFEQFLLVPASCRLSGVRRALRLSFQFLLCRGRAAPCATATRADHAPGLRTGRRASARMSMRRSSACSRPCRCRARRGGARARDRPPPRAAAPGAAAHRHPARLRAESAWRRATIAAWRPPRPQPPADEFAQLPSGFTRSALPAKATASTTSGRRIRSASQPARIARGLVTNAQWLEFMADGGYATPSLWLSDGWAAVEAEGWNAPGYWRERRWCMAHVHAAAGSSRSIRPPPCRT